MRNLNKKITGQSRKKTRLLTLVLILTLIAAQGTAFWLTGDAKADGSTVYLNGSGGSDEASGASSEEAVRSFSKAKELAGSGGTIQVCGTVSVSGNTTWSLPAGVSLKRAPGFSGAIVNISGTLTLKNITLSKSDISGTGTIAGQEEKKADPTPEPTPEATQTPEPTPEVTETPEPTPEVTPTPEPTPEATETPEPTPEVTETPAETPAPDETPEPAAPETEDPVQDETAAGEEAAKQGKTEDSENKEDKKTDEEETAEESKEAEPIEEDNSGKDDQNTSDTPEETETPAEEQNQEDGTEDDQQTDHTADLMKLLGKLKVTVENQSDIAAVIEATKAFDALSQDQQAQVPQELIVRLKKAQLACQIMNRNSNGITVDGDFPWYVQFRAQKGNSAGAGTFDLGELIGSYEMTLWNLLTDSTYKPESAVTVTMPLKDAWKYQDISVIHYLAGGSYEILIPEILENAIRFTTNSFSPYNIAGNVLVGNVDKVYSQPDDSSSSSAQSSSGSGSGTGNSSVSRPASKSTSGSSVSNTSGAAKSNTIKGVRTEDNTNLIMMISIAAGAVLLIVILLVVAKRKNKK